MKKALSGLCAWIAQRFTAVYMLFFLVFALIHFAFNPQHSYENWREFVATPFVLIMTALFFVALLLHMWVGLRDVIMDYVKPLPLRVTVLATLILALSGLALKIMQIFLLATR